jgi:hypothetical protein
VHSHHSVLMMLVVVDVYMCEGVYGHMGICVYVCMWVCLDVCVCVCVCVCVLLLCRSNALVEVVVECASV